MASGLVLWPGDGAWWRLLIIDEEAIADALESGRLGGYAADVFAMEDWMLPGHPTAISGRLLLHPQTLFTPHLGSAVDGVRRQMSLQAARQVRQVLDGNRPDHAVNLPEPWPGRRETTPMLSETIT